MGVATIDYNEDGRWDLFVANDAMENFLFENKGDGKFEENALLANVAYGADGDARGSMGAEVGDVNGDGQFDLFVPDFTSTCLYVNQGSGFFEDQARQAGLAQACARTCPGAQLWWTWIWTPTWISTCPTAMRVSCWGNRIWCFSMTARVCSSTCRTKRALPPCRRESVGVSRPVIWTTTETWTCW